MGASLAANIALGAASTGINALSNALDGIKNAKNPTQAKAKELAEDFEAVFLNTMFSQMFSELKGEGPFGAEGHNEAWRGMLSEEYSKNIAKSGGIGLSSALYTEILAMQEGKL